MRKTPEIKAKRPSKSARKSGSRGDHVQSLVRALNIINRLAHAEDGITLTEVAQQLGLSTSTTHRLLTTLMEERYVHFDGERRLWSVGVQAFSADWLLIDGGTIVNGRSWTDAEDRAGARSAVAPANRY